MPESIILANRNSALGLSQPFVQDNWSRSDQGVLRGLHLQNPNTQGILVSVVRGRIIDVAVDVRIGSPSFGRHVAVECRGKMGASALYHEASPMALSFSPDPRISSTNAIIFTAGLTK